jgi:nicotinamide-nucleotide adenylyltransferase
VVRELLRKYPEVIIMIGSAESPASMQNPFTTGERIEMIRSAFNKELSRLIIIPVRDVNNHHSWVSHVLSYIPAFQIVYSNNELVMVLFANAGYEVKETVYSDRKHKEGSKIRSLMANGNKKWKYHVPKTIVRFIESIKGEERLKLLSTAKN